MQPSSLASLRVSELTKPPRRHFPISLRFQLLLHQATRLSNFNRHLISRHQQSCKSLELLRSKYYSWCTRRMFSESKRRMKRRKAKVERERNFWNFERRETWEISWVFEWRENEMRTRIRECTNSPSNKNRLITKAQQSAADSTVNPSPSNKENTEVCSQSSVACESKETKVSSRLRKLNTNQQC